MNDQVKRLTKEEVNFIKEFLDEVVYNNKSAIIYRGQVPMAAYVLVEGKVDLRDSQKKVAFEIQEHCLLGFSEICLNKPYRYTAEIYPGSKVLILDRSTINQIKEIFKSKKPKQSFVTEALLTSIA